MNQEQEVKPKELNRSQPDIEVLSVIATDTRASITKKLTLRDRKGFKTDEININCLKDNATTDIDLNSAKDKTDLSDESLQ